MDLSDNIPGPDAQVPPAKLDYEILRLIGKGGYGEVWLVRDKQGEYRACKVVYRESFHHDRPYEREYEGICKFEPVSRASESQVKILYVGRRDEAGYFFYIMELADDADRGMPLQPRSYVPKTLNSELLRRGRLPVAECIEIGLSLCDALDNLHQHRLIHRDVKPANVIFVKGIPKLADIGLVSEMDVTVSYVGTGGFIPPEGPSSEQADIYALGKTLYEISTGKDRLEYPELPENFGDLPDRAALLEFNAVVAQACETDKKKRYSSVRALRADLILLQNGKSIRQKRSANRRWKLVTQLTAIFSLLLLAGLTVVHFRRTEIESVESVPTKPPPVAPIQAGLPDPERVAQIESKIKDEYSAQLARDKSADEQQAAFELAEKSGMAKDPATRLASLRVAALLAVHAGNFPQALQTCEQIGELFRINSLPEKTDLLVQAGAFSAKNGDLAAGCLQTGFDAIANDDYTDGQELAALAKKAAEQSGDGRLIKESEFLGIEMARCANGFEQSKPFQKKLKEQPDDPGANLAVGEFLCFIKNDWDTGMPLLARATNGGINAVAATELDKDTNTPAREMVLGNDWRKLADADDHDDKIYYQRRAGYWYLKAMAASAEPDRTLLRQQLGQWLSTVPTESGEIHILTRHNGNLIIDIYSDLIKWKSVHGAYISKINQIPIGDLKAGDLKIIKNTGATWFMPDGVDFSTARLIMVRKARKQEKVKLEKAPDHVRITLSHPKSGFAETEVTVVFGKAP